jgi:hypothetical protein
MRHFPYKCWSLRRSRENPLHPTQILFVITGDTRLESVFFKLFTVKERRSLFHTLMCTCSNNLNNCNDAQGIHEVHMHVTTSMLHAAINKNTSINAKSYI